jgi:hypothetical protein
VTGRIKGRGYFPTDAPLTLALGMSTSLAATILLFLYVANDAYPRSQYPSPDWLFGMAFVVFLWTARIWLKSHRGRLDDDPVVFALRDRPSLLMGVVCFALFVLATH